MLGVGLMPTYAATTEVSAERSRTEIERTLTRFGASGFLYGWEEDRAVIQFRAHDRYVRFVVQLPVLESFELTPTRQRRSSVAMGKAHEQAVRQRWRALLLVIKAKLEAVESEITSFESEFLAHIVLPDGTTVGAWVQPQVAAAYETGAMPKMLPAGVDQ